MVAGERQALPQGPKKVGQAPARRGRGERGGIDGVRSGVQSTQRALSILQLFSHERPELSLMEIASALDLHPSTTHRLASALVSNGLLSRSERTGQFRLGFGVVKLAGVALNQTDFVRHSLPELDALRDSLGLNANLAVLRDDDVLHLAYAVRRGTPRYYTVLGRTAVPNCTALGKVLLAAMNRAAVHEMISRRGWRPYTPYSIADFERLDSELDEVSARGYAIESEERTLNSGCVGAPVHNSMREVVAAISVSGSLAECLGTAKDTVIRTVLQHATMISQKMGDLSSPLVNSL
jgi:IclR family transcriptional regulator, acetate operon repressor